MTNALISPSTAVQASEARRHAYNAAFEELGLTWHWDAATYARLQAHGCDGVRVYLETEQAHLLRAYEAGFLVDAIETIQKRCFAEMGGERSRVIPFARPASMSAQTHASPAGQAAHRSASSAAG
ncbi:MAG: hypothetical protein Q7T70_10495 [Polaromonas sp.]|nr:hypothetical protein [Polaromonas sp.]